MVAIMNNSGAFIYGCTEKQADERIENHQQGKRGNLDYDENGNYRLKDERMIAWFFMSKNIIWNLVKLGCTAIYINRYYKQGMDYKKFSGLEEISFLDTCLRNVIDKKNKYGK